MSEKATSAERITNTIETSNAVKCVKCNAQHMADSPECPVKIKYRREKKQKQQEKRETNQQTSTSYLSSPARLYSKVLQTMARVHADTKPHEMTPDRPTG